MRLEKAIPPAYTALFVAGAVIFLIMLALGIDGVSRTIMKAVPVATLLVLVLRSMRGLPGAGLACALFFSVCGDIFLDLPHEELFIFGLLAFLLAHLFYTALFFRYAEGPDALQTAIIGGLAVFAASMIWLFSGIDPSLYPPVVIYVIVIVTMSVAALLVRGPSGLLFSGALLFIASDVVLAVNKFLVAIPFGRLVNITLYFIAQFVIIAAARRIWQAALTARR
jgi:uncharacterized membrane protein YhhN